MGWFNTVLDVASLGVQVSQLGQLSEMRQQGASSAVMQAILQQLRNQIFNFKQAAQSIVDAEATDPKAAAGAMRVVELRLNDSGISTDLFSDLNDKEYVANTYKFVTAQSQRLKIALPTAQQDELEVMAQKAHQLPEYGYYLDHLTELQDYKTAQANKGQFGFLNAGGGLVLGCSSLIVFAILVSIFGAIFRDAPLIGGIIGAVATFAIMIWAGRRAKLAKDSKKRLEELEKNVDIEYLQSLDQKFRGDKGEVERLRDDARESVNHFFGDSPLLPI